MKRVNLSAMAALVAAVWLTVAGCAQQREPSETAAIPYPLDTCLVSGEKLGADPEMKPYTFVHHGQEIKLCCKSCLKDFNKDPEKYLAKLKPAAPPPAN